MHVKCGKLRFTCTEWKCSVCVGMLADSVKRMQQEVRQRRLLERKERGELRKSLIETQDADTSITAACSKDPSKAPHNEAVEDTSIPTCFAGGTSSGVDKGLMKSTTEDMSTPKRKISEVNECGEESASKVCQMDLNETITKVTYASDSDEEIDVELGEYQVPPQTVIRELEESGEELDRKLKKLKDFAIRAQERMQELRLTELEIVKMAKESSSHNLFLLDKTMVMKFFHFNLPLDKMLQTLKIIKAIYSVREAVILSAQSSDKKKPVSSGKRGMRRRRKLRNSKGVPDIQVTIRKSALLNTITKASSLLNNADDAAKNSSDLEEFGDSSEASDGEAIKECKLDTPESQSSQKRGGHKGETVSKALDSPSCELSLNLSFSPRLERTPLCFRRLRSSPSLDMTPPSLKIDSKMDKEKCF